MQTQVYIEDGSMEQDVKVKRAIFVEESHHLQEEFFRAHPEVQSKLLALYNSSCYGSNIWNLYGPWVKKLYTSWNVSLRYIWDLPHETHRYFYEHLSECRHLKALLIKRFLSFVHSIVEGRHEVCKMLLYTISNNVMSVTGSNLRNIGIEAGERILLRELSGSIGRICEKIQFEKVQESEAWRIPAMKEVALIKSGYKQVQGFSDDEIDQILRVLCTQ